MKIKSIVSLIGILIMSVLIVGCEDGKEKQPKQEASDKHKQELIYFEQLSNGDEDYPRAEIGYKGKNGKTHTYTTESKNVYEHILKDSKKKPYVIKDGKKYHVYRLPYMTYDNNEIEGEVKDKGAVSKDD
ncbi:hypothetical protein MHZ36_01030 [Staphylococcus sp. ACRSN]|uniref:hypothetical protein n=1 Tax=Staphylococcus sp. ACRSN TaxID=2918214 RepID=UPI001EF28C41|nr:hypothetical protein [Staphylococcus sp. ACRSN]MCG7337861.1 hypothetical protein [Staphylococcus sp. ACRSN]